MPVSRQRTRRSKSFHRVARSDQFPAREALYPADRLDVITQSSERPYVIITPSGLPDVIRTPPGTQMPSDGHHHVCVIFVASSCGAAVRRSACQRGGGAPVILCTLSDRAAMVSGPSPGAHGGGGGHGPVTGRPSRGQTDRQTDRQTDDMLWLVAGRSQSVRERDGEG